MRQVELLWEPGAVVLTAALRGLRAGALAGNESVALALRRALTAALLPQGYPPDAVFLATVRDEGGLAAQLEAADPVNRAGAALPSIDGLMAWLGWPAGGGDAQGEGEADGNSTLALSYAGDARLPRLTNGTLRVSVNLLPRAADFAGVEARVRAQMAGGGARARRAQQQQLHASAASLSAVVAQALANATGAPAAAFSLEVTAASTASLLFSRSRWRRFMDWILRNAWVVIGAAGGLAVGTGAAAALRGRCAKRAGGAPRGAAARAAAARAALAARTAKWRAAAGDLAKPADAALGTEAPPTAPDVALPSAASLPSDVPAGRATSSLPSAADGGAWGGFEDDAAMQGAVASAEATAAAAAALRRGRGALPLGGGGGARLRAPAAAPLAPGAPLRAPAALRALGGRGAAAAFAAAEAAPVVREAVVQRAAGRSLAARAKAAAAVQRLANAGGEARADGARGEE